MGHESYQLQGRTKVAMSHESAIDLNIMSMPEETKFTPYTVLLDTINSVNMDLDRV